MHIILIAVYIVFLLLTLYIINKAQHVLTDAVLEKPLKMKVAQWTDYIAGALIYAILIVSDLDLGLTFNNAIRLVLVALIIIVVCTIYVVYLLLKIDKQTATALPNSAPR